MNDDAVVRITPPAGREPSGDDEVAEVVAEDLLIEEVSIDGMCGVY